MGSSEGAKGVGGYRPTINWRDITIKRKNVADKQVLACIILSGVVIIIVGLVLTILGFLVIKSQCPFDWSEGMDSCYYFAQHNASWESGREYCESQGATLLDIHTDAEEKFIVGKMEGPSWLGLHRKKGEKEFVWVSGSKLSFYHNEISDAMINSSTARQCGVIENEGDWKTSTCNDGSAFVICEYVPRYNPFMLIGPVIMFCGVILLLLSIEVCVRRMEFLENNPEVMLADDDDRQVDEGLVNYGYGNFGSEEDISTDAAAVPRKTLPWPVAGSPNVVKPEKLDSSRPSSSKIQQVIPIEDTGSGPKVNLVPASLPTSPSLATAPQEDHSQSQEQLELLLSPKTLE